MKSYYRPWWPDKPRGTVYFLRGAGLLCIFAMIAGGLVTISGSQQFLPGLAIVAGNFVLFSLVRAARYILELLIWQRENELVDELKVNVESE